MNDLPQPQSRLRPSRPAAVMLLAVAALLVLAAVTLPQDWWIVLAYPPLLLTAGMGVMFAGRIGFWSLMIGGTILLVALGVAATSLAGDSLTLPQVQHRLGAAMAVLVVALTCFACAACYGWFRFFTARA